jgi:hypothetical protein
MQDRILDPEIYTKNNNKENMLDCLFVAAICNRPFNFSLVRPALLYFSADVISDDMMRCVVQRT